MLTFSHWGAGSGGPGVPLRGGAGESWPYFNGSSCIGAGHHHAVLAAVLAARLATILIIRIKGSEQVMPMRIEIDDREMRLNLGMKKAGAR